MAQENGICPSCSRIDRGYPGDTGNSFLHASGSSVTDFRRLCALILRYYNKQGKECQRKGGRINKSPHSGKICFLSSRADPEAKPAGGKDLKNFTPPFSDSSRVRQAGRIGMTGKAVNCLCFPEPASCLSPRWVYLIRTHLMMFV